jgi:hypothetical protein
MNNKFKSIPVIAVVVNSLMLSGCVGLNKKAGTDSSLPAYNTSFYDQQIIDHQHQDFKEHKHIQQQAQLNAAQSLKDTIMYQGITDPNPLPRNVNFPALLGNTPTPPPASNLAMPQAPQLNFTPPALKSHHL